MIPEKVALDGAYIWFNLFDQGLDSRNRQYPNRKIIRSKNRKEVNQHDDIKDFLTYHMPKQKYTIANKYTFYVFKIHSFDDIKKNPYPYFDMRCRYREDDIKTAYISVADLIQKFGPQASSPT